MDQEEVLFNKIVDSLSKDFLHITKGKMMSAPAIKYKNKVIAFFYKKEMIFRLGEDFDPKEHNVKKCRVLNPFKNKAPMKNWFQIPYSERQRWEKLTKYALIVLKEELRSSK